MSDNKNPEEAVKQLAKAARDLAELRRIVCGDLPAQGGVVSMEDRLGIIERQLVSAAVAQDEPQTTQPLDAGPDFQDLALTDIEWGIPKTAPKSDFTDTIILRPCEADGNEYVDAVDVVVYLRNDRSDVQLGSRGWLAKVAADPEADPPVTAVVGTILSFQRFPWDVGSPAVHGVLVGEGPGEMSVEWGHPYSAAPTSPSTTIDLVTCDENGDALDDPEDITVYIRNDQSEVNIDSRGWDQDTLLSFVRSVENDDGVAGVLVGEGQPAGVGSADAGGSFTIHYSYSGTGVSFPEQETFWTLGGSLNSFIQIALDVRMCDYDLPIGNHPGNTEARTNGGFAGNGIASWLGDDDAWLDLSYTVHDETGTIVATGVEAISGFHLEARVAVSGDLDIRAVKDADWPLLSCVIAGAVWRKSYPAAPGTIEVGSGGCHDDTTWGDGVWEPPA